MDSLGIKLTDLNINIYDNLNDNLSYESSDILRNLFKDEISIDDVFKKLGLTTEKINELINEYNYIFDLEDIKKLLTYLKKNQNILIIRI